MPINNACNFLLYNNAGIPLFKNPKFKKVALNISATSGNIDLYTVPAGKNIFILQIFSYLTASTSLNLSVKSSGNYYKLGNASTFTTNFTATGYQSFFLIKTGETAAVNALTAATGNITLSFIEFDNDSSLKRYELFSLVNGNNTVYTCPTGYQAYPCSFIQPINNQISTNSRVNYYNGTGAGRTISIYYVPNGSSPGSTNLTFSGSIGNGTNSLSAVNTFCFPNLQAGDSYVINTDSSASTQVAWINVIERKL